MTSANSNGSCLARVSARLHDRSKAVVRMSRFIVESPAAARNMAISQLARACGTTAGTVSRFCASLGYSGYKQFQLDLATALAQSGDVTLDDLSKDLKPRDIVRRVFECNRRSLSETEKIMDPEALVRVARILPRARRILILGIGGSGLVAEEAADRLMSLGLTAIPVTNPYRQIFATSSVNRSDVVIGISHTGQTTHIVEATRAARDRKARTVALTNYPQSPLVDVSQYHLITAFREHRVNAAVSSSRVAQICVIDALYFVTASYCGRGATTLANRAEERAQATLRTR